MDLKTFLSSTQPVKFAALCSRDPLHYSSRSVISRTQAVYCVVFLVSSQLVTAKRRLTTHPDPLGKFSPELCGESLKSSTTAAVRLASCFFARITDFSVP